MLRFNTFDESKENWAQYIERLDQHFVLHNVTDLDKKQAFLLSSLDLEMYKLLQNLFGELNVLKQAFADLMKNCQTISSGRFVCKQVDILFAIVKWKQISPMQNWLQLFAELQKTVNSVARVKHAITKATLMNNTGLVNLKHATC